MPRYYTIASSALMHPKQLTIAVSLEDFAIPGGRREGLTSRYLKEIMAKPDGRMSCRIFTKLSNFEMPASMKTPIVMVGPGTGVVPYIGFI